MFNAQQPSHEELPTSAELLRSTLIAAVAAVVILVSIVLPAEYAIDPTGLGRAIGLTEMGEIKQQLEEEADDHSSLIEGLEGEALDILAGFVQLFVGSAHAQDINSAEMTLILANGESAEIKIDLSKGQEATYTWSASDKVNFELHVDKEEGGFISYKKGRGVDSDNGAFVAAIDGYHGWFWRNRSGSDVTITVKTEGPFTELKRMK
tara:strand:- start:1108 stop:1728 length:621 start_codon:yes stop_codon:yes gene_type:complete